MELALRLCDGSEVLFQGRSAPVRPKIPSDRTPRRTTNEVRRLGRWGRSSTCSIGSAATDLEGTGGWQNDASGGMEVP